MVKLKKVVSIDPIKSEATIEEITIKEASGRYLEYLDRVEDVKDIFSWYTKQPLSFVEWLNSENVG
jgi:hypothetical protein